MPAELWKGAMGLEVGVLEDIVGVEFVAQGTAEAKAHVEAHPLVGKREEAVVGLLIAVAGA